VGQSRQAIRLGNRQEIAVLQAVTGIFIFDRLANGAVSPVRGIFGSNTGFSSGDPNGLVYLAQRNELVVGNYQRDTLLGEVLVFPATEGGNQPLASQIWARVGNRCQRSSLSSKSAQ